MSNWVSITADDLKSAVRGEVIDAAATLSTGANNPIAECIADAVAKVRAAVSTGNTLDVDTTKVPNSLRALTVRIAVRALKARIPFTLTEDERAQRTEDASQINRIADNKIRAEEPDNPDGSAEMQRGNLVQAYDVPRRQTTREQLRGL